jgi:hypothetical protein
MTCCRGAAKTIMTVQHPGFATFHMLHVAWLQSFLYTENSTRSQDTMSRSLYGCTLLRTRNLPQRCVQSSKAFEFCWICWICSDFIFYLVLSFKNFGCIQHPVCRASGAHLHVTRMSNFRLFQRSLKLAPRKSSPDLRHKVGRFMGGGGSKAPSRLSHSTDRGHNLQADQITFAKCRGRSKQADHSAMQTDKGCSGSSAPHSSSPYGALNKRTFMALSSEPVLSLNKQVCSLATLPVFLCSGWTCAAATKSASHQFLRKNSQHSLPIVYRGSQRAYSVLHVGYSDPERQPSPSEGAPPEEIV